MPSLSKMAKMSMPRIEGQRHGSHMRGVTSPLQQSSLQILSPKQIGGMISQQRDTSPIVNRRNDNAAAVAPPSSIMRLHMSPGGASNSGGGSDTESNASPRGAFHSSQVSSSAARQSRPLRNQRGVHSSMDTAALKAAKGGPRNKLPSIGEMVDSCQRLDSTFAMKEYHISKFDGQVMSVLRNNKNASTASDWSRVKNNNFID